MTKAQIKTMLEKRVELAIQVNDDDENKQECSMCKRHTYCYSIKLSIVLPVPNNKEHYGYAKATRYNKYVSLCECCINGIGRNDVIERRWLPNFITRKRLGEV